MIESNSWQTMAKTTCASSIELRKLQIVLLPSTLDSALMLFVIWDVLDGRPLSTEWDDRNVLIHGGVDLNNNNAANLYHCPDTERTCAYVLTLMKCFGLNWNVAVLLSFHHWKFTNCPSRIIDYWLGQTRRWTSKTEMMLRDTSVLWSDFYLHVLIQCAVVWMIRFWSVFLDQIAYQSQFMKTWPSRNPVGSRPSASQRGKTTPKKLIAVNTVWLLSAHLQLGYTPETSTRSWMTLATRILAMLFAQFSKRTTPQICSWWTTLRILSWTWLSVATSISGLDSTSFGFLMNRDLQKPRLAKSSWKCMSSTRWWKDTLICLLRLILLRTYVAAQLWCLHSS